jgi:hypothetical protein
MRPFLIITTLLALSCGQKTSKYTGKYEANGMVVQVAVINNSLSLIVPGAPIQHLQESGENKFKTNSFSDEFFVFVEKNGKIEEMVSQRPGQSLSLKKIADTTDDFNKNDALLTLKKSTPHFSFLYSSLDSATVIQISEQLERDYKKIPADFKVTDMPTTTVRIYPDLASFHQGINFPNAPESVMATAFGKDDFRMVSPNAAGVDKEMLIKGVTHEFTHCVHLNVDYSPNNPRWLWEGVAMYEAGWFLDPSGIEDIKNKNFPSLNNLQNGMEYMLGFVIIEAIKDIWGFDIVLRLIKKQGDVQAVLKMDQKSFEEKIWGHIYGKYVKS